MEKSTSLLIRFNPQHKELLADHFKNHKGLSLSAGIRTVLFKYMIENGLITPDNDNNK